MTKSLTSITKRHPALGVFTATSLAMMFNVVHLLYVHDFDLSHIDRYMSGNSSAAGEVSYVPYLGMYIYLLSIIILGYYTRTPRMYICFFLIQTTLFYVLSDMIVHYMPGAFIAPLVIGLIIVTLHTLRITRRNAKP